jgi:HAD superfamily hydrolase (TIGR01549 family)
VCATCGAWCGCSRGREALTHDTLPRPHVVFFDLFGTVFKWSKPPRQAIADVLARHGHPIDPEAVWRACRAVERKLPTHDEFPGESEVQYWRHHDGEVLATLGVKATAELLGALRREIEQDVQLGLQDDALPALGALKAQGAKLGVISNATFGMLRDFARLGLDRYIEHVVFSQPLNARKPDPHIFLVALSKYGCPPSRAWMVGDELESDVRGARGVGIVPILIDREGRHPDATVTRIADLRELVPLYRDAMP